MRILTLSSPAKLNIILKVINKRPDGYHNLKTLFERIDLADTISFRRGSHDQIKIRCNHPQIPLGPQNLVYRVAQRLKNAYGIREGIDIQIIKRIPVAAGLAGGSSNAATALIGLNKFWGLKMSRQELLRHAAALGSDISFFIYDTSWAVGTGRGERIRAVSLPSRLWHILIVPCAKMYSREVFTCLKLKLTKQNDNVNIVIRYLKNNNIISAGRLLENDLESSILQIRPRLAYLRKRLEKLQLRGVAFSGSGPAVYGITESRRQARQLKTVLKRTYSQVFVVRTL
jgi:4-diphosphocytidyl-2-C-methyl-D-erythritol kinase